MLSLTRIYESFGREEVKAGVGRFVSSFSVVGSLLGLLFFSASLTPSLLPRPVMLQGILAGLVFATGYGIGWAGHAIWHYMELRDAPKLVARWIGGLLLVLAIFALSRMTDWQNSVRTLMDMEPVDSAYPLTVVWVAVVTALLTILVSRLLLFLARKLVGAAGALLPRRVAIVVGGALFMVLLTFIVNGVLLSAALRAADETFAAMDRLLDEETTPPAHELTTGSAASLIHWDDIGRNGKRFILEGPTREEIEALTGREAKRPLRVYAGFRTGETLEERARVALEELKRVGGFDRSVLIVATATGTGWLDPSAVNPVEFLHGGDIATVSMQYSYLPSWLTLMAEPEVTQEAGIALFRTVYDHWTRLPNDERPRLYAFGLSLGALGTEHGADLITMFGDPIQGSVLSGPPFLNPDWGRVTRDRNPGSPAWRPVYRDSALVRFMTQDGFADLEDASWGPYRVVYLQYPSDPMTFFRRDLLYREPDWMSGDRGRDVSPSLRWFPVITFFQIAFDITMSTNVPLGYGHSFAPEHYIDAWIEVMDPPGWTAEDTGKLKAYFEDFEPSPL